MAQSSGGQLVWVGDTIPRRPSHLHSVHPPGRVPHHAHHHDLAKGPLPNHLIGTQTPAARHFTAVPCRHDGAGRGPSDAPSLGRSCRRSCIRFCPTETPTSRPSSGLQVKPPLPRRRSARRTDQSDVNEVRPHSPRACWEGSGGRKGRSSRNHFLTISASIWSSSGVGSSSTATFLLVRLDMSSMRFGIRRRGDFLSATQRWQNLKTSFMAW